MLRVTTIYACSAAATAAYYAPYLDPEHSGEAPGLWQGRQAEDLGLTGAVSRDDLEALLSGQDPETGEALGRALHDRVNKNGRLIKAVSGFDCTFSAPKSVSVWWGLTGDDRVLEAHNVAVQAALEHLETYGAGVRVRVGSGRRQFLDSQGLTMAVFQQSTSREDDPQIHTHAVVSGKVRAPNGSWYALDAKYLKSYQRAIGGIYQSVLRAELTHRFGVRWGPITEAQAELADMPPELLHLFSKRAGQVEARAAELVAEFTEANDRGPTRIERAQLTRQAATDSRRAKSEMPVADAATGWIDEGAALGWTGHGLSQHLEGRHHETGLGAFDLREVLDLAAAKSSAWTRMDLLKAICDIAPPTGEYTGAEWARILEATADRVAGRHVNLDPHMDGPVRASDGRSVWLQPYKNHLSHDLVLAQEDRILTFAHHARPAEARPSTTVDVDELDVLQADAARAVAGHDRLVLVVGPAGAGKTTTLRAAATDLQIHGRSVFGVAPTRKATRVLESETGMPADTVAKLLSEYQRPGGPNAAFHLRAGTTLVVDETGMVGTADLDRLVGLAQSQSWRLVLVGDPRQLQAVSRGGMFNELVRTGPSYELATIHRFHHEWERDASRQLRHGDPAGLDAYLDHRRVHPSSLELHLEFLPRDWVRHHQAGRSVAVTAETNEQVDQLNQAIQSHRRDTGELDPTRTVAIGAGETAGVGDIVQTRRNNPELVSSNGDTVANRDTWTVDHIGDDGTLTVSNRRGHGTVELPGEYAREHVRLGYAATAYGHQGDTVDVSFTLVTTSSTHAGLYVGATRGRQANHLCVVAEERTFDHARDVLEFALTRDRADTPARVQQRDLAEQAAEPEIPRPVERDDYQSQEERLGEVDREVIRALERLAPFERALDAATLDLDQARRLLAELERQRSDAGVLRRHRYQQPIDNAFLAVETADVRVGQLKEEMRPVQAEVDQVCAERDQLRQELKPARMLRMLDELAERPALEREGPELGLSL